MSTGPASKTACPWCSYPNPDDAQFCGDCGRLLELDRECPSCAAANPGHNIFCDACGTRLIEGEAAPAPASQPVRTAEPKAARRGLQPEITLRLSWVGLALAGIVAMALVVRLVGLMNTPPNVSADEADNLQVVYRILDGSGPGFFGLDWKLAPAFSTYVITWFTYLFGDGIVGLRMASVVLSTAALLFFYFVARRTLGVGGSLAATFLLSVSLWFLHFSRSGWENVHVALFMLGAVLSVQLAIERRSWYLYALAGLFAGLGLYGFAGGRAIVLALVVYLPVAVALHREQWRRILIGFGVIVILAFVLFLPQLNTALDDWGHFNRRIDGISVLNTTEEYRGDTGLAPILIHQTWRTIDGFILMDSGVSAVGLNGRYLPPGWAVLDRLTGILFWIGLVVSAFRWRQTLLWWTMLLVMVFPIQVLSTGTPDAARAVGAAPLFFLFVGLALDWLLGLRVARGTVFRAGTAVALAVIATINLNGYFGWMDRPETPDARQPAVEVAEFNRWRAAQKADIAAGGDGFNVGEWHEMR